MPSSPHIQLLHPTVSPGTAAQSLHGDHPISAIACAPSRPLIALGNHHGTISIRNAQTGEELQQLDGHTNRIHECTFSPDSRWLLSASLDGTLLKWHWPLSRHQSMSAGDDSKRTRGQVLSEAG